MSDIFNKRVLIVGLGLIGGSVAHGLKKASKDIKIDAFDLNGEALTSASESGVIDKTGSLEELLPTADVVVIALPATTVVDLMSRVANGVQESCIITDVASVKTSIVDALYEQPHSFQAQFVPGHPIAGSEQSGFSAASDNLFVDRNVILTPHEKCSLEAIALINELWRQLGANVFGMDLKKHDEVLAATSHLPHLLAYSIVDVIAQQDKGDNIFRFAAGGFAGFTRLASSDAKMWSDIFVFNAKETTDILDIFIDRLTTFKDRIINKDHEFLMEKLVSAKGVRDEFVEKHVIGKAQRQFPDKQMNYLVKPGGFINGSIKVPGDKSISHRAIIFGSIAEGVTKVSGFLEGEDSLNTLNAFREMGVTIIGPENGDLTIYGVGMKGLKAPRAPLYMGNSGTAMRLLAGLLAAQQFPSELTGDESLSKRPMSRVVNPLQQMGAKIRCADGETPPIKINKTKLKGISYEMKIASAQVKSCLILAGLFAEGETTIREPTLCRDHTERMLKSFGYKVQKDKVNGETKLKGGGTLCGTNIDVPADISSAAFFIVAASITPGASLDINNVGMNPTRTGIINLLQLMGANITIDNEREICGEPVADLSVSYTRLQGINVPEDQVPLAIDEFPVFFIAAACAAGVTELRGAAELRVKESDRLEAMAAGLRTLGIVVETRSDGIRIQGGSFQGGRVDSFGDHRVAMAFVMAGLIAREPIEIRDCANVATSFPHFVEVANEIGIRLTVTSVMN
ncbi:MAG: bifunctional prephenate dehydrogenase/3-phosphoshikimate 1-carboxyvinyltransferase [Gammaproteobacteria bacterium]|nr:bifunctional prephenate dehydrogenase/3-phosphoshikimate 1-carboxyvinyltransferase [Gammaproteobacteria bacterium]